MYNNIDFILHWYVYTKVVYNYSLTLCVYIVILPRTMVYNIHIILKCNIELIVLYSVYIYKHNNQWNSKPKLSDKA